MKLRIQGNSIRLRLTKTEIEAFHEYGSIADVLELPGGDPISYALEKCGEPKLNVKRIGDSIRVGLPNKECERWKSDDCVGFTEQQSLSGRILSITVEKDFKCTTPSDCGEVNTDDLFDNPQAQ